MTYRLVLFSLLAASGLFAAAQKGTVRFGGLPVPGATVTATKSDKKITTVTGVDGSYTFADLADGEWAIRVEMLGFEPGEKKISVAGETQPQDIDMKVMSFDAIKATTTMLPPPPPPVAAPPLPTSLNAANAKKKGKPAPAANAANPGFQRTEANAVPGGDRNADNGPTEATNQSAADSFAINGSSNNAAASNFGTSAAFGNSRRGPGSLYTGNFGFNLGNSALDARSYSLTGQDTPKPAYNHLQGSASFGGPLRIPHLINNKQPAQFFITYQLQRNRNANVTTTRVPTAAERAGQLASGTIPASLLSPQALALLKFYPMPNFDANARYNYQAGLTSYQDADIVSGRLSKTVSKRDQVFGTFSYQNIRTSNTNIFAFHDQIEIHNFDVTANISHRFNNRIFGSGKAQYNTSSTRVTPNFANKQNVSGDIGITGNLQDPLNYGPPSLNFSSGIASLYDAQASFNRSPTLALSGNIYWNHTPHNFTFGGDYKHQQFNSLGQQNPRGSFTFTGAAAGSDLADFLTGVPDTSSIAYGNADKYFRSSVYDLYFTDDWRVAPGLTLNLGARWEYNSPITELRGRLVNLDIASGFKAVAPVIGNQPTGSLTGNKFASSLVSPDKSGLQPRLAASWRPIAGSSLVVRAGYGMNYNTSIYQAIATQMAQQSPLSRSFSVQNTTGNPLTLANGFRQSSAITANTFAIDPNFKVGYVHTWSLSVQRDLPGALVATVNYLGILGRKAQQASLPNTYPTGATNPCPSCPSGFTYLSSDGSSSRESLQMQLRRRLRSGLTSTLQYTYAKAIDNASLGGRNGGGGAYGLIAQNWLNLAAERGLSNFDQRHVMSLSTQYTTGMGVAGGTLLAGWRGTAFKDWTVSTNISAGTGTPQTPVYISAVAGTGVTGTLRPDYTGASIYSAPSGLFLNPAAFRAPAAGQWGNTGRNTITGPGQFSMGASMTRTFRVRDRINMDVRLDSNNVLNHVNYSSWVTTLSSPQFGLPSSASQMRTAQASVRLRF